MRRFFQITVICHLSFVITTIGVITTLGRLVLIIG